MALLLFGSEKTTNAFLRYLWCATEDLVSSHWKSIQAVANALLKQKTLKYEDAIEVIFPGSAALRESLEKVTTEQRSAIAKVQS
jgi:hypothetical protein